MSPSTPADIEAVLSLFERRGIACLVNDEHTEIAIPDPARDGWSLRVIPQEKAKALLIVYPLPGAVPEERVPALTAAANLLNVNTLLGAWVLNPKSRELVFRLAVRSQGVLYSDEGLLQCFQIVIGAVQKDVDYLDRVLKGADPW